MPNCYVDAHGRVLVTFGGPGDQKVVDWPVASWANKPLTSWRGIWVWDPGMFLVIMTLASFWALEPMAWFWGAFLGSAGLGSPNSRRESEKSFLGLEPQ